MAGVKEIVKTNVSALSGFKAFLLKTNVAGLAVGVIIGLGINTVVQSLVNDVVMPPVGYAMGNIDFANLRIVLKATGDPKTDVAIRYGMFINTIIAFLVLAFVVYVLSSLLLRPEPEAPTKTCPFCMEKVPVEATRCRACTSMLDGPDQPDASDGADGSSI
jgi:large conductance mechanosensitive channel